MAQSSVFLFAITASSLCSTSLTAPIPKKDLHSSCFDLEDGAHYLQILSNNELSLLSLSEDNYLKAPIVHVRCHDGYAIIDPYFEPEWITYFSTWHEWKVNTAGPDLEDHVSWNEWFLPSQSIDDAVTYTISPDCQQCIGGEQEDYIDKVYYMSGDIFSCYWPITDNLLANSEQQQQCVMESSEYSACSKCHDNGKSDKVYYSANCGSMIYDTNTPIFKDHRRCMENPQPNKLPSIGTNGAYCVCYKPLQRTEIKQANWADHYASDSWDDEDSLFDGEKEKQLKQDQEEAEQMQHADDSVKVNLYQTDFNHGTYRIREPGTYTIMEDITFNFNPGGIKHPNARYSWMPHEDQEDVYPGASAANHDDFYAMGFFAGITVETDNVVINLNEHSIAMDLLFYTQQRVFSCIALTNKLFPDENGESVTFMGIGQQSANNVVIKNGVIGLSSHMGIFGMHSRNVHLLNVHVRDFETHGIVFDQFDSITMKSVEIGPSVNGQLKVNNRYSAARLMLPTFYAVADENDNDNEDEEETQTVSFNGRGEFSMKEIVQRLVQRMDLAFEYAINGEKNIDVHSDVWRETKQLFINQEGVSTHGSMYGLVLRPNKGELDGNGGTPQAANIQDVFVHDLIINPQQVTKIGVSADLWLRNSFNAPIDLSVAVKKPVEYLAEDSEEIYTEEELYAIDADELPNIVDAVYYGDVYTDALFAMRQLSDSWWSLGRTVIWPQFIEWSQGGGALSLYLQETEERAAKDMQHICGYDVVAGVAKGITGIHVAYSEHIEMANIEIENLINMGSFGNANCDYYGQKYRGNHATAMNLYQSDYVHVDELNVQKIVSFSGPAYGIYIDRDDGYDEENIIEVNKKKRRKLEEDADEGDEQEEGDGAGISVNYATFSHIDAGVKATYDGIDMSEDDAVNYAASSCAVYCGSSCDELQFYDLEQQCMNGHVHCEQYRQMLIHHECQRNVDYVTPIGTIHVSKNGKIDADLILPPPKPKWFMFKGQWFALGILVILVILGAIKCVYFKNCKDKHKNQGGNNAETNPLIGGSDNSRIDYSTL